MTEEGMVGQNEKAIFYTTDWSKSVTEYAKGLGLRCFVAEQKANGSKDYILVNDTNEVVYSNQSFEAVCYRIDALRLMQQP